ncbi:MAG: sugar transferase [Chlorobi bacterium]|nr:sugar transferase [Chlorobiota bacterium]
MYEFSKRAFDIISSLLGLVLLSPIFAAIALIILITDGKPIIFKQIRVGKGGKPFTIYKFRTMRQGKGLSITQKGDPRITPIGRFLRKYKLDELPQLWNVLKGDMSVVGPRPEVPEYVKYFPKEMEGVLSVRPGLTDLASLVFINEEEVLARFPDPHEAYVSYVLPRKLKLNMIYIRNRNMCLDMWIIFKTLKRLLK